MAIELFLAGTDKLLTQSIHPDDFDAHLEALLYHKFSQPQKRTAAVFHSGEQPYHRTAAALSGRTGGHRFVVAPYLAPQHEEYATLLSAPASFLAATVEKALESSRELLVKHALVVGPLAVSEAFNQQHPSGVAVVTGHHGPDNVDTFCRIRTLAP